MQVQVVLIIDPRTEMSQKYKRILQQDCYIHAVISHNLQEAFDNIEELEPDLIIVADNFEENINDLCAQIRKKSSLYRPVLVVLSKSSYLDDKLNALKSGADDYMSEPIDSAEFSARIFAHLRRHVEELSNLITGLPLANVTYKVINRTIKSGAKWALMYLDIDDLKPYTDIYGYIATDKVLKTYTAILKSSLDKGDFLGHIREDSFIILTDPLKADKIAAFLNFAFDSVSPRFYNVEDAKRGYLILDGDEKAGIRVSLVATSIGIISNQHRAFNNYQEALTAVINMHKLAKAQSGSSWISDRPKICGEGSVDKVEEIKRKILIFESDAALAYLLTTTLEMQGYIAEATSCANEVVAVVEKNKPDLILLDTGDKDPEMGLEICRQIKANNKFPNLKIIVSTIIHDKERVLDAGADLYLPKPYELMVLFGWVNRFLKID
ncbi:MAG: hypothetical protein A2255_06685 [Candidatus Melainabacteria bacterium RIFOXYA2_FULL_32_9]|nr:MAG: hypothetical protein A2255_06685 [Candidatus Melainabacteria bacterium RIFOXYA2_FULL_32_9]